jgi:hypothetical protein
MASSDSAGAFVPTTFAWDSSELQGMDVTSDRFKEMLVNLCQNLDLMQSTLNLKDSAHYNTSEFVNGQVFFPSSSTNSSNTNTMVGRQVYRKVINFGALPNTTTKSVTHDLNITTGYTFTRIYATASDTTNRTFIPIPNASTDINLEVDATNVKIKTAGNFSSYDTTYVILEYLKS